MQEKILVVSALVFGGTLALNVPAVSAQTSGTHLQQGSGEAAKTQRDAEGGRQFPGAKTSRDDAARSAGQSTQKEAGKSPRDAEAGFPFGGTESTVQGYPGHGQDAKELQQALRDRGHDPGAIDGVMGPRTRDALRSFQEANNLSPTGRLDSDTAAALGVSSTIAAGTSGASAGAPTKSPRDAEGGQPFGGSRSTVQGDFGAAGQGSQGSMEDTREVQQALKDKGHNPGRVDGIMGPRTQQAIRDFQQANGLPATGRLDAETAAALGVDSAGAADAPSGSPSQSR